MTIEQLENIMVLHGIAIRAIPSIIVGVYDKRHIDKFPDGEIMYLEEYKREMLVQKRIPKNAGKFVIESNQKMIGTTQFYGRHFYDSIEEAVEAVMRALPDGKNDK